MLQILVILQNCLYYIYGEPTMIIIITSIGDSTELLLLQFWWDCNNYHYNYWRHYNNQYHYNFWEITKAVLTIIGANTIIYFNYLSQELCKLWRWNRKHEKNWLEVNIKYMAKSLLKVIGRILVAHLVCMTLTVLVCCF